MAVRMGKSVCVTRSVTSEPAEQAESDIRLIQARLQREQSDRPSGEIHRTRGHGPSDEDRLFQLNLTTIVAIAEHFASERLISKSTVPNNAIASWPKREGAY